MQSGWRWVQWFLLRLLLHNPSRLCRLWHQLQLPVLYWGMNYWLWLMRKIFQAICLKISVGFESVWFLFLWLGFCSRGTRRYHTHYVSFYCQGGVARYIITLTYKSHLDQNNWIGTRERQNASDLLDCSGETDKHFLYH